MFGYASDETPDLMPATLDYSHKILERMARDRKSGAAPFLEPDAKSQVTLRYRNERPVEATAIVVSTQHAPGYYFHNDEGDEGKYGELRDYVKRVIAEVLPADMLSENTVYHINPTGRFEIGGPDGDAGLTGRKIIVDTYGGGEPARRRRVQRQGPDQGRSFGGLCHPLPRQERGRGGAGAALHDPDRLCHRRGRAAVVVCRSP